MTDSKLFSFHGYVLAQSHQQTSQAAGGWAEITRAVYCTNELRYYPINKVICAIKEHVMHIMEQEEKLTKSR